MLYYDSELRTELRRLKEAVFVNATGANAHGDVPVGLTQEYWDTGNRSVIGWDAIHKFAPEQNGTPGASNNVVVNAMANTNATSVEEDDTSSKAKSVKRAKRVKLAKSTALWCLMPFTPLMQEAKDKPRKVCPVHLRGEVCTANNCGSKHPKVCLVADHGKGKIPKATCSLLFMRVPFAGNFTGRRSGPKLPPAARGAMAAMPGRPSPSPTSASPSSRQSTPPRS
jgi:hypothetical protein